jgi:hypothetical protein
MRLYWAAAEKRKSMSSNKTMPTGESVDEFLNAVPDERKRQDCRNLVETMKAITGEDPAMWGSSLVGFGQYHYRYASGHEGDFFLTGFAPRKSALTVYIMPGCARYEGLLQRMGPHKTGKSCLYLKSLETIDRGILEEIIRDSVACMREKYDCK